jgi:hypothetical protein
LRSREVAGNLFSSRMRCRPARPPGVRWIFGLGAAFWQLPLATLARSTLRGVAHGAVIHEMNVTY